MTCCLCCCFQLHNVLFANVAMDKIFTVHQIIYVWQSVAIILNKLSIALLCLLWVITISFLFLLLSSCLHAVIVGKVLALGTLGSGPAWETRCHPCHVMLWATTAPNIAFALFLLLSLIWVTIFVSPYIYIYIVIHIIFLNGTHTISFICNVWFVYNLLEFYEFQFNITIYR